MSEVSRGAGQRAGSGENLQSRLAWSESGKRAWKVSVALRFWYTARQRFSNEQGAGQSDAYMDVAARMLSLAVMASGLPLLPIHEPFDQFNPQLL